MTSDLSIGTVVQSGNQTIVTGTASGLDTNSLIENAVAQNNSQADLIDIRVQDNQAQIDAYNEYYGLAQNLQDSLSALKSVTSLSGEDENIFEQRTGNLTSNGTEPTDLISVSIEESAPAGSYDIVVEQKAEAFSTASTIVTDKDAALAYTGTFEIGLDGLTASTITVTADQSLQDIADAINAESETSGVQASILKVSENDYQLILTGTQTNTAMSVQTLSGDVLQNLGIVDGSDVFVPGQIIQQEQGSQITLDGATITRDDNTYDDLIAGVSFDITAADPATTITLEIDNDAGAAKDAITTFLDSYNALRDFVIQNQQVNADGTVPEDAVLFSEPLLENLSYSLSSFITSPRDNTETLGALSDLGIVLDDNNRLIIDDEVRLDEALLNDFASVESFFSTQVSISDSQLGLITNNSSAEALDFELQITTDVDGNITAVSANGNAGAFDIDGDRLTGRAGTPYEGLTFAYIGDTDATISVSLQAGLADQMFNLIEGYTNPVDGLIQQEINQIQTQNDEYSAEIDDILARGEEIREREIERYSRMEAELARLESLRNTIQLLLGNDE